MNMPAFARRGAAALLAAALLAACDSTGSEKPVPGELTVTLDTPTSADRSLVLSITGPEAATAVTAAQPAYVVYARTGAETKVAVFGPLAEGPLVKVSVPDVKQAKRYTATVLEAAAVNNLARASLAGYTLTVSR